MEYRYEAADRSFGDFASGRVLYNARGTTSFPVRLASEIAQRCFAILRSRGHDGPYEVYDPCCGGAYLLASVGLLHGERIAGIYASDIDPEALRTAERNLSLLTADGLDAREAQLRELYAQYGKASHAEALASVGRLRSYAARSRVGSTAVFRSDISAAPPAGLLPEGGVHLVIADLPYGGLVDWGGDAEDPIRDWFGRAHAVLNRPHGVAAVIADKGPRLRDDRFARVEHFRIGKRQVAIAVPIG